MKKFKNYAYFLMLAGLISCSSASKGNQDEDSSTPIETTEAVMTDTDNEQPAEEVEEVAVVDHSANEQLIRTVYEKYVFGWSESSPRPYFTNNALRKLKAAYDYDCENGECYEYAELRTNAQDGPSDVSKVTSIEPEEDGWYVVSYKDMGNSGVTRVKIVDGKIDDYKRIKG